MNCVYTICFAFCLVGCWGAVPFSEKIKAILEKRSLGENIWNYKRAVLGMFGGEQRNTHQKSEAGHFRRDIGDHCLLAEMCVSQGIAEPSGNISTGIQFGMDILQSLCNSTGEYLGCYDMMAESYPCGPFSTLIADVSHVVQESLCRQPWTTDVLSLLQCMNNRRLQILIYGEHQKLAGVALAYQEMGLPDKQRNSILCHWLFRTIDEMMHSVFDVCGENVYSTVCETRNRLEPYISMLLSTITEVDCPKEGFRCTSSEGLEQHGTF